MSDFKKPKNRDEWKARVDFIESRVMVIAEEAKHRLNKMRSMGEMALAIYLKACPRCHGLGWTWCCKVHRAEGGPPQDRCLHLKDDEYAEVGELKAEMFALQQCEDEMGIHVTDIEDESLNPHLRHVIQNAAKHHVPKA